MADTTGLDPQFATLIEQMIAASGGRLWINSGYRSDARQAQLYQQAVQQYGQANAGKYVAPPGESNHNKGLAVDLGGDLNLAHQLAPRFGLTFPMSWEPWHIEPPWARSARGASYMNAMTTPPDGSGMSADDPYSQLHTQINNLIGIITGKDGATLDAQLSTTPDTAAKPAASEGPGLVPGLSGETSGGPTGQWNAVTWAHDFLTAGGFPVTDANMQAIQAWERAEGGLANNNPLNTTQSGYSGEMSINSVGVKRYASYDDSIRANLQALNNGRYGGIIAALQQGDNPMAVADAIAQSPWGTGTLVQKILGA